MTLRPCRITLGFTLAVFVLGVTTSARADDAKKRELALAKCAATYRTALSACEKLSDAVACYQKADADDRACRSAQGAAGNSTVEPEFEQRRRITLDKIKKPLNCGTGINATCADGHARFPTCNQSTSQSAQASQGIGGNDAQLTIDAQGERDVCSGALKCPSGFTLVTRKGQDLCWDSAQNLANYKY